MIRWPGSLLLEGTIIERSKGGRAVSHMMNREEGTTYGKVHICEKEPGVVEVTRADCLIAQRDEGSDVGQ